MVYYQDWAEFFRASEALLRASGGRARCVTKYRHCSGQLELKVTDDATVRSASPPRSPPCSPSHPQPPLWARPCLPPLKPPDGGEGGGRGRASTGGRGGSPVASIDLPPPFPPELGGVGC